jgi:EAL domain-containing protein (putative c-di-GMP-specific phosphodiesterase class I)
VVGIEALLRWDNARNGSLSPSTFIPVAEGSGLIQLQIPAFVRYVDEAITASQIDGKRIELEITEGLRLHDPDQINKIFKALRSLEIRRAIDDFGTGYSSLTYL